MPSPRSVLSFLLPLCLSLHTHAQNYFTNVEDGLVFVPNWRFIKNEVNKIGFNGYSDVWASSNGRVFTSDLSVTSGQAWPQITEGTTGGDANRFTPGYPITVSSYLEKQASHLIVYNGSWTARTNGEGAGEDATGARFSGAYIWLNDPGNKWEGTENPKFPFSLEINIWNRHDVDIGAQPWNYDKIYYDSDGGYRVSGGRVDVEGDEFDRFFFLLEGAEKDSLNVNVDGVLEYLRDEAQLDTSLEIVSISVAAEGHAGADGKFVAVIDSMGRP